MQKKGFFTTLILLASISLAITLVLAKNEFKQEKQQTTLLLLEIEKSFFKRAEIENNIDQLISKTMEKEIQNKNFDPQKIREKIAQKVTTYIKELEEKKPNTIFYFEKNLEQTTPTEKLFEEASKVIVFTDKKILYAQFIYTGGNENNSFKSKITYGNFSAFFELPKNYTLTITKVFP